MPHSPPPSFGPRWIDRLCVMALAAVVIACYGHTLESPFVLDDHKNLLDTPALQLRRLTPDALLDALVQAPVPTRPVANLSFALNHYLHRLRRPGYHVVNIAVHLLAGLLLMVFARQTLELWRPGQPRDRMGRIAFHTALLWVAHPLQTQSVTYIVQRMNALAALFYLAAMTAYVRARRSRDPAARTAWIAAAVLAGLLAVGSKENAATLPLFLLLYEWFFFQRRRGDWLRRHWPLLTAAPLLLAVLARVYIGPHPLATVLAPYANYPFTVGQRLLTEARVVWFYLSLIVFPHPGRLNLDHQIAVSTDLFHPWTTLPAVAGLVVLVPSVVWLSRRHRLGAFLVLWYFGNLAIESSVFGPELIFEHRAYLPSMAVVFGLVTFLFARTGAGRMAPALCLAAALALGAGTVERNRVWADRLTLWQDVVAKAPRNPRAHNNLGLALAAAGEHRRAADHFRRALSLDPANQDARNNLALALANQGDLRAAIGQFRTVLARTPRHVKAWNNLGLTLARAGRPTEAEAAFRRALGLDGRFLDARYNLALLLDRQGRPEAALTEYTAALDIRRTPDTLVNVGTILARRGDLEEAARHLHEALRLAPGHPLARRNLAIVAAALAGQRGPDADGRSPEAETGIGDDPRRPP